MRELSVWSDSITALGAIVAGALLITGDIGGKRHDVREKDRHVQAVLAFRRHADTQTFMEATYFHQKCRMGTRGTP